MALNLSNLSVDSSGRVSFSGLGSGIDFKAAVDSIIAAKRIPADSLKARITANEDKIAAYKDFKTLLSGLKDRLAELRGAVNFGGSGNVFSAKQAFASASRVDGQTPSAVGNLLGVTVANGATLGTHTIEVLRTATAHKVGSQAFAAATSPLGLAGSVALGVEGGPQATLTLSATDTLQDVRDRINSANTGANKTGISASIVSVGPNINYLVLTPEQTGKRIEFSGETGGILAGLGISADGGVTLSNELQAPQTAQFYADGLLDPSSWRSAAVSSQSATLGSLLGVPAGSNSFEIRDAGGAVLQTVSYSDTDNLQTLAQAITAGGAGITASVVQEGTQFRLNIAKDDGSPIAFGGDSGNLLTGLALTKQPLLIERDSNTVDDLFAGVTLSLYGAEAGTSIKLEIDRSLTDVKSAITGFVDAYNAIRQFVNEQSQVDEKTGQRSADAGPLFGSRTLASITAALGRIVGNGTDGVDGAFSVLAQAGIELVDNSSLDDPMLKDTLKIDGTKLDGVLLSNPEDIQRLFAFDFSASDPRITLLGFSGKTTFDPAGYSLSLTHDGTGVTGATINGLPASATVNGNTITLTDATGAEGLVLFYSGSGDLSDIQLDFTVGAAQQMFSELEDALDTTDGSIQAELNTLTDQNDLNQDRIDEMLTRLDYQREQLTQRFIVLETSLSTMQRILDGIKQQTDAWYKKD
ncbi:MAG: flagellar filament capping protein FliD [Dongiaceae bacterium]